MLGDTGKEEGGSFVGTDLVSVGTSSISILFGSVFTAPGMSASLGESSMSVGGEKAYSSSGSARSS